MREIAPRHDRVAFLAMQKGVSPALDKTNQIKFDAAAATAKALGMTMAWRPVPTSRDLDGLFRMIAADGDQALYVVFDPLTIQAQKRIAELALSHKIPAVFEIRDYVVSGGLVSYTYLRAHNFERAAVFIDKILKGANPAELPVEQPTKFELVINFEDRQGARPRSAADAARPRRRGDRMRTARVHHAARRRGGGVAARGARAAAGDAGDRDFWSDIADATICR